MRKFIFSIFLIILPIKALSFEVEARLIIGAENATDRLKIISTTDIGLFQPALEAFTKENPKLSIEYIVTSTTQLMQALVEENAQFDLAISSAMDLQTKLANDGYTLAHSSAFTSNLPDWAKWRQDVFAFTQEPAALVLSKKAFEGIETPKTREDLIRILRNNPDRFEGKIGTYDLRQSGLGYLFATQDSHTSEVYWRLTEVMGAMNTRLYTSSGKMIEDVASGRLALAYNVLGSYAVSHEKKAQFEVIFPTDYTTVMMRTAVIPASANNTKMASAFIDYLLQISWQNPSNTNDLRPLIVDFASHPDAIRRIRLGPGLLVFLDRYKKRRFISAWKNAIVQN